MPGVDLHAHTTASDGSLSPTELVNAATHCGLDALAVTDHDTLSGLDEALAAGERVGLEVVPGVELAVEHPGRFHLLGYLFDPSDATLGDRLAYLREFRAHRNRKMVEKMQSLGLPIDWEKVVAESGGDLVARPHMALALMRQGIVKSTQEAFDRYLQDGGPAHVPKIKLSDREAIGLIRGAGGVPVIAHPTTLKMPDLASLEDEIVRLAKIGVEGIEVYYSQHDDATTGSLAGIAERHGLIATGGSDFHGASKPQVPLGVVTRGGPAPSDVLQALKERCERVRES